MIDGRWMWGTVCHRLQFWPSKELFFDEKKQRWFGHCNKCEPRCIGDTHEDCCFIEEPDN